MADSDAKPKLTEQDITGLKFFDQLAPLLQRLHDDACERDTANNRKLFYDQYGMLMLLYFFNPIVTSLRGLQQASELKTYSRNSAVLALLWDLCRKPPSSLIQID